MKITDFSKPKTILVGVNMCRSEQIILPTKDIFINPDFTDIQRDFNNNQIKDLRVLPKENHEHIIFFYDISVSMITGDTLNWYLNLIYLTTKEKTKIYIPERFHSFPIILDHLEVDNVYDLITFKDDEVFTYPIFDDVSLWIQWDKRNYRLQYFMMHMR